MKITGYYRQNLLCLMGAAVMLGHAPAQAAGKTETVENPVAFTMGNIARGKKMFSSYCIDCHGANGRGDTGFREFLKTPPADLVDDQWIYGEEDAQIFDVIKRGRLETDMPAFGDVVNDKRIWYIVNYVKYLNGKRP